MITFFSVCGKTRPYDCNIYGVALTVAHIVICCKTTLQLQSTVHQNVVFCLSFCALLVLFPKMQLLCKLRFGKNLVWTFFASTPNFNIKMNSFMTFHKTGGIEPKLG